MKSSVTPVYAHSLQGRPCEEWQLLSDHSVGVAKLASEFARPFKSSAWAAVMGCLHDIGKARISFQRYLLASNGLLDVEYDGGDHSHSGVGAAWAVKTLAKGGFGRLLAYPVAGHHAGLPDWIGGDTPSGSLALRLDQDSKILFESNVDDWIQADSSVRNLTVPPAPWEFGKSDVSFWIRMLYSCLVDADYLDTELFSNPDLGAARDSFPSIEDLAAAFFAKLDAKQETAARTEVNVIRSEIRIACEAAADQPQGMFTLTVPTGGGKTLSGTAFAFRHALKHGLKRIIYVIPYTSIIEQTADVLREFIGASNVVEHHSNFDPERATQQSRLASENWDAPVVVTTNVQFFESLYASKPSACRKLHNIADSVVILDEAQLLPPRLLLPCVEAMNQLVCRYGVSFVLSTATQPALPGIVAPTEIIPQQMRLYERLRRTKLVMPDDMSIRQSWEEVAKELITHDQVLCVVNTRRDCHELYSNMPTGTIHLSANMCGEHRSRVIGAIKALLHAKLPIRVISTQLVEAGVDIDFPIVYRAFAGLSSIAQSGGRCNREGLLKSYGRVIVFMPPTPAPRGDLRDGEYALSELIATGSDLESPSSYTDFFRIFYNSKQNLGTEFHQWLAQDAYDFQFQFREASAAFKMIDDQTTVSVIVRYGENGNMIDRLRFDGPTRDCMRKLQRYSVTIPRALLVGLLEKGFVEEICPGVHVQTMRCLYDNVFGFDIYLERLPEESLMI